MTAVAHTKNLLSIVVPLYNEQGQIEQTVIAVRDAVAKIPIASEILLVDDGSVDGTWEEISKASSRFAEVSGFRLSRNFGKEAAICAGLEKAQGVLFVVMDGDLQHPPEIIPQMYQQLTTNKLNLVEAVKDRRSSGSFWHHFSTQVFYVLLNRFSGFNLQGASDYKLFDCRVHQAWLQMGEKTLFFRGMMAWLGFKRGTVSFLVPDRMAGESRWSFWSLLKLALVAIASFSSLPLRLINVLGGLFLVFALWLTWQALHLYYTGQAVGGFTTVIILQLIIGSILMFALGIIGEYLGQVYQEVKGRPRYILQETTPNVVNSRG